MNDRELETIAVALRKQGWILGERFGGGGGGDVHFCYKADFAAAVSAAMDQASPALVGGREDRVAATTRVIGALYRAFVTESDSIAAVKISKAPDEQTVGERERVTREIDAMGRCAHAHLVRVLASDANRPPRWFVMPYYPLGDVASRLSEYRGQPLKVLAKVRPVVDALRTVHEAKLIHRDVKAGNVFIARNGDWILGDLGIVFDPEADRLTSRTVFSKHWRPDWVDGLSLDKYGPEVDIFMVAKLIYFMVSGLKVPASQVDEAECDVRRLFPDVSGVEKVHQFFLGHVVAKRSALKSTSANQFLTRIDALMAELQHPRVSRHVFGFISSQSPYISQEKISVLSRLPIALIARDTRLHCHVRLMSFDQHTPKANVRIEVADAQGHSNTWVLTLDAARGDPGGWVEASLDLPQPVADGIHTLTIGSIGPAISVTGVQVFAE